MEKQVKNKNIEKISAVIKVITLGLVLPLFLLNRHLLGFRFSFDLFLVHVIMYVAELILLMFLTRNYKASFVTLNIVELIFAIISSLKVATRCEIFEPWDLAFTGNLNDFTSFINIDFSWIINLVLSLTFLIGITIIQIFIFGEYCEIPKSKAPNTIFIILSILTLVFFITSYKNIRAKYIEPYQVGYNNFQPISDIGSLGALNNFLIDIGMMNFANSCDGYSEENIDKIYEKYKEYNIELSDNAREYDNVIMILLESFIDVTKLEELEFANDPLENYHKYFNETNSGYVNAKTIGGGTSNTEYMALTGYSVNQYPIGIYPYMHCIKRDVEALPNVFKDNGYDTTGIHLFKKEFYNRNEAYPLIGIDSYITREDIENPAYYGNFISDMEIVNELKNLIENQEKSFVTISTMGTHTPYVDHYYETYKSYVTNEKLNSIEEEMLNNYIQALVGLDDMIGNLVEYINLSNESTLLIMYGDHYPLMYQVYEGLDMIEKNENNILVEKYPNLFKLPYVVYSNKNEIKVDKNIIASDFCRYILENVKLKNIPWYYNVIYDYAKNKQNYDEYRIIQYDEIFGKKFWKKY